jgi:aryl-alcohol dehydrogenase-like predicted oxidoreductase
MSGVNAAHESYSMDDPRPNARVSVEENDVMSKDETTPKLRQLGSTGPKSFPIALGCMGMSGMYGPSDESEAIATIHEAIERGVNVIDTGDFYGMGHNEMLIGRALAGRRDRVLLSVKFGALRGPDNSWGGVDARPVAVKNFLAYSLKRLGTDHIDIYRPARLDPQVPIEDTIGAIAELIQKGYVRYAGLSEVGVDTIRRAAKVSPISDLQIEYALISRKPEAQIFPVLNELGISATLYGVLSRGLLSGSQPNPKQGDYRAYLPRFSEQNRAQNQSVVDSINAFASARGMTAAQVAIGWVLAKQPGFIATIGARKRSQLTDALRAVERPLSQAEVAELEKLVPENAIAGTRYDATAMAHLDSEK